MSIIKNMTNVSLPQIPTVPIKQDNTYDLKRLLCYSKASLWKHTKNIVSGDGDSYFQWAAKKPAKAGFDFKQRLDFWASKTGSSASYEPVAFLDPRGKLVFPWYIHEDTVYCTYLENGTPVQYDITKVMPVFPKAVKAMLAADYSNEDATIFWQMFQLLQIFINKLDSQYRDSWYKGQHQSGEVFWIPTSKSEKFTTKEEVNMTKATQVKTGMVETNKEALKAVAYLNAGRASNKLIKEAMRPMLNMLFKPTFMQRIGMKLFKMENPVDVALKSTLSDLLCAQLAQAIVELKGVENEHVREVTKSGITYAGLKVSELIPFEQAMDEVVAKLEQGAEGIVSKISKK